VNLFERVSERVARWLVVLLVGLVGIPLVPVILVIVLVATVWDRWEKWRLRREFRARWGSEGKRLLFVYSNSPHWKERIEHEVLPLIEGCAVVLNWSERSTDQWKSTRVEVRAFRSWSGQREFNPMAILFPEEGPVRTIRFWQAYRDFKHGKPALLRKKEAELLDFAEVPEERRFTASTDWTDSATGGRSGIFQQNTERAD
jgi:hypothetical protein